MKKFTKSIIYKDTDEDVLKIRNMSKDEVKKVFNEINKKLTSNEILELTRSSSELRTEYSQIYLNIKQIKEKKAEIFINFFDQISSFVGIVCLILVLDRFLPPSQNMYILLVVLIILVTFMKLRKAIFGIFKLITLESVKFLENKLIQLDEDYKLEESKFHESKFYVEWQFSKHSKELRRYYDMNLTQSKLIFFIGILLILFGCVIILITIIIFKNNSVENSIPIITGCVSGIFIDVVGLFFIKIYSSTVETSLQFHKKLSQSNSLIFASALAERMEDGTKKDETLSYIATEIIKDTE